MKTKNLGLTASGTVLPKINPGEKWKDARGIIVTVLTVNEKLRDIYGWRNPAQSGNVIFQRAGYSGESILNISTFRKKFRKEGGQ
ncbi:DUF4222 domain-containing protein [Salmonella enterica subsp. enterica]|nr:DUF4222 domain-containing protein [Salmonella enterica subsp. enterica serovar Agbeni]